jgi:Flp pilus assembly protein protease CpaA
VDIWFGLIAIVVVSVSLSYAAIQDYKTREVTNWLWVGGLVILPITLIRIGTSGLSLIYGFQLLMVFIIVILGFRLGILGGADGKALLFIALTYPWIVIEGTWLLFAPVGILVGGFLIVGVHSLVLLILNAIRWRRGSIRPQEMKPLKRTYWITRRLIQFQEERSNTKWEPVSIPLVVYILIVYVIMLGWTIGNVFV